jgi:hypothetical protein
MNVNKFKILFNAEDRELVLPIETNNDYLDQLNDIGVYETKVLSEILNNGSDFEVARFAHAKHDLTPKTDINYEFYFSPTGSTPNNIQYFNSYLAEGFTATEVYYFRKQFKNSFFKIDFYDSKIENEQINYLTIIIPTQQGDTTTTTVGLNEVKIKTPKFKLDYIGDLEGYFIYWLRTREYLDISRFYMTAKFFDARLGIFVKMMNRPQNQIGASRTTFDPSKYFYYQVDLNYDNFTYKVYDDAGLRVGDTSPIKWYEYINP